MSRRTIHKPHPSQAAASDEPHDGAEDEGRLGADVEAAGELPTGPDAPPPDAPPTAEQRLQAQIDELKALLSQSAAAGTVAPPGYKLVKDEATQDQTSLLEQAAIKAEIEKGTPRRTQEHCDRLFPEGKHVFRCVLAADKNGNPELLVRAANPTDAAARYLAACGINHTEHRVSVARA